MGTSGARYHTGLGIRPSTGLEERWMMTGVSRSLLVVAALLPAATQAQEATPTPPFNYTYVELGYDEAEYVVGSVEGLDGDGLTLSGSFEITVDWHAYASYNTSDLDV